jgi:hypothetical protein
MCKFSFVLRVSLLLQVLRWPLFLHVDFCRSCVSRFLFPARALFSVARLLSGFPSRCGDESRCPFSFCSSRSALRPDFSAPDLSAAQWLLRFCEQAHHSVVDLSASSCLILAQVSPTRTGGRRLCGLRFSPLGYFSVRQLLLWFACCLSPPFPTRWPKHTPASCSYLQSHESTQVHSQSPVLILRAFDF